MLNFKEKIRVLVEQNESLSLDDKQDREALIKQLQSAFSESNIKLI